MKNTFKIISALMIGCCCANNLKASANLSDNADAVSSELQKLLEKVNTLSKEVQENLNYIEQKTNDFGLQQDFTDEDINNLITERQIQIQKIEAKITALRSNYDLK